VATNPQKPKLREQLLAARATLDKDERERAQTAIGTHLVAALADLPPGTLAAYWPIRGEPELAAAWAQLRALGWQLCLPVVVQTAAPLVFRAWDGTPPTALDACRLRVPAPDAPEVQPTVLTMPCLGFDAHGHRLGYGGGYYDRTLAQAAPGVQRIGIAFELQACTFAVDAHDLRMHRLVTERGVRRWDDAAH